MSAECQACTSSTGDGITLCTKCVGKLQDALSSVSKWLMTELRTTIVRQARFTRQGESVRSATTPLPWNDRASRLSRQLHRELASWVQALGEGDTEDPIEHVVGSRELARWLWRNMSAIRSCDAAGALYRELTRTIERCGAIVDRPVDMVTYGMCANTDPDETGHPTRVACDEYLYGVPNRPAVKCRKCGAVYDVAKRKEWMLQYVGGMVGTASEVATYLRISGVKVSPDQVRKMKERKRISAAGRVMDGKKPVDLYRFSDVITAMSDRYKKSARSA